MLKQISIKIFKSFLVLLIILSFITTVLSFIHYLKNKRTIEKLEYSKAAKNSIEITNKVNEYFKKLEAVANNLANEISSGKIAYKDIPKVLEQVAIHNPEIYGIAAVFKPYSFSPEKKLYSPFCFKDKFNNFKLVDISDKYDYTLPPSKKINTSWYHNTLKKKSTWLEPFYGPRSGAYLIGYGKVFYKANSGEKNTIAGAIIVDYTLEGIRKEILSTFNLDEKNSLFILSKDGTFIAHPNIDYCGEKNIADMGKELDSNKLNNFISKIQYRQPQNLELHNTKTGNTQLFFSKPLKCTKNWSVVTTYDKTSTLKEKIKIKRSEIASGLSCLIFVTLICLYVLIQNPFKRFFQISSIAIISISILALISYILATSISENNKKSINIYDNIELNNFLNASKKNIIHSDVNEIIYIPTGVEILSIQFTSKNSVDISGFIWQKIPSINQGNYTFTIPESIGASKIEKMYERKRKNYTMNLYKFSVKLQYIDTGEQYPFDRSAINLSIWPKEFDQHFMFIPDLSAYDYIDPARKPGIIAENITGSWKISKTNFSFTPYPTDASFGYLNYLKRHIKPYLLTYNINIERNIWPPFISNILPCIIISILIYFLISFFAHAEHRTHDTSTVFNSLRYFGGLLIFVALMHGKLTISGTGQISYLEYCYLLIYICIFFSMYYAISLKQYNNTFTRFLSRYNVVELIYWPLLLFAFLILTLTIFW